MLASLITNNCTKMKNSKLVWHPKKRKVKDLKNWAANPRKISKEAFEKLKDRFRAHDSF